MTLPSLSNTEDLQALLEEAVERGRAAAPKGELAGYIPELLNADPAAVGIALAMLDGVCREQQGRPQQLEVGIMVEVPAVAVNAAAFAPKVDFVSIGTNDLAQYALAAERGNEYVAHLSDALDPGVLRLMQSVVTAAGEDTRVAVCGELAADLTAVPILVGLGIDELSVNRFAVAAVKDEVRHWSQADAAALATQAMGLNSAAEVRTAVRDRRAT